MSSRLMIIASRGIWRGAVPRWIVALRLVWFGQMAGILLAAVIYLLTH